jgi:hypothetical protein
MRLENRAWNLSFPPSESCKEISLLLVHKDRQEKELTRRFGGEWEKGSGVLRLRDPTEIA